MAVPETKEKYSSDIIKALNKVKQMVAPCIQCGTCSASCPNVAFMDFTPRQMWRMVLSDQLEDLFASKSFTMCSACYWCTLRCPRGLELTKAMAPDSGVGNGVMFIPAAEDHTPFPLGPTNRSPPDLAIRTASSCRACPFSPVSAKSADMTMPPFTPFLTQLLMIFGSPAARTVNTARSTWLGISRMSA